MSKVKKSKYPDKTYINLLINEKEGEGKLFQILLFILFILILAVFTKYAVVDRLQEAYEARSAYEAMEAQLLDLQAQNEDYEEVRQEYSHFGNGYLSDDEIIQVDRMKVLGILEEFVTTQADIQNISISGNIISLNIGNTRLSKISSIVSNLEDDDRISYVTVSTAGTGGSGSAKMVTANMTIVLEGAAPIEETAPELEEGVDDTTGGEAQ